MSSKETTKLLSSSPPPQVNRQTRPPPVASTSTSHAGIISTLSNVFQLVHGAGESVRGRILGTIDDWENKGERRHHDIARNGEEEVREAYARLRSLGPGGSVSSSAPAPAQRETEYGYTSGYDAAPPSYQATRPDSKK